jgi:hypothetical protein
VRPHAELTPTGGIAEIPPREMTLALVGLALVQHGADEAFGGFQKMAGLGREFVETAAEDFRGEAVGGGDVPKGGADVGACDRIVLERALVLVEQGDGVDESKCCEPI